MRNLNESNITEAVVAAAEGCADARLKQVLESLVRHLHAFVRDIEPSEKEWQQAIDFLTRTGQRCDGERQEFILLSDLLGVTMLVDAIAHRPDGQATESTVLGPFYVENPPEAAVGSAIDRGVAGEPLFVEGRVLSAADGAPIEGAEIDVWQSDGEGFYDVQKAGGEGASLRARFRTGPDGRYAFWTVTPSSYPVPTDGPAGALLEAAGRHAWRPAHVHFMLTAEGCERLVTQVFAEGERHLESDAVFGVKDTLVRSYEPREPGTAPDGSVQDRPWRHLAYDFRLRPAAGQAR